MNSVLTSPTASPVRERHRAEVDQDDAYGVMANKASKKRPSILPSATEPTYVTSKVDFATAEMSQSGARVTSTTVAYIFCGNSIPSSAFGEDGQKQACVTRDRIMSYWVNMNRQELSGIIVRLSKDDWGPFMNTLLYITTVATAGPTTARRTASINGTARNTRVPALGRGAITLHAKLGLDDTTPLPRRITTADNYDFITKLVMRYFGSPGRIPPQDVLCKHDPLGHLSEENVQAALNMNRLVFDPCVNVFSLVQTNRIKPAEVRSYMTIRREVQKTEEEREYLQRADLSGPILMTFQQRDSAGKVVPGSCPIEVVFTARPGNFGQAGQEKLKHLYIYGDSNFGKSQTIGHIFLNEQVKACQISDPRNAMGANNQAQFLVMDEYCSKRGLRLNDLKALTSGDCSAGAFNRKSHGHSFIPRRDAQIIILSNYSPYRVYANQEKGQGQKRLISKIDAQAIENRFQIVALGVDNALEKRRCMEVSDLTEDEYRCHLHYIFYKALENAIKKNTLNTRSIRRALNALMREHIRRYTEQEIEADLNFEELRVDLHFAIQNTKDLQLINSVLEQQYDVYSFLDESLRATDSKVHVYGHLTAYEIIKQAPKRQRDADQEEETQQRARRQKTYEDMFDDSGNPVPMNHVQPGPSTSSAPVPSSSTHTCGDEISDSESETAESSCGGSSVRDSSEWGATMDQWVIADGYMQYMNFTGGSSRQARQGRRSVRQTGYEHHIVGQEEIMDKEIFNGHPIINPVYSTENMYIRNKNVRYMLMRPNQLDHMLRKKNGPGAKSAGRKLWDDVAACVNRCDQQGNAVSSAAWANPGTGSILNRLLMD